MSKTLSMVMEPHAPTDMAKVAALSESYEYGWTVPPVVVLVLGDTPWALSGSHRLTALRQVYDGDEAIDDMDEVLVVDGDARGIYDAADAVGRKVLDRMQAGRFSPADDLDAIRGLLPRAARVALEGQ